VNNSLDGGSAKKEKQKKKFHKRSDDLNEVFNNDEAVTRNPSMLSC